jgi:hypothetical protein
MASATMDIAGAARYRAFGPEQTQVLGTAFDAAWATLEGKCLMADHNIPQAKERLGQWIVALAQRGEQDPSKLADYAVAIMRI